VSLWKEGLPSDRNFRGSPDQSLQRKTKAGFGSVLTGKNQSVDQISLQDIIDACNQDDTLAIECLAIIGEKLGKALAMLFNIFNPELFILGGVLSATNDYISLPIKSALNKYAQGLVSNDTDLKISKLGDRAGVIGACLLVHNKLLAIN